MEIDEKLKTNYKNLMITKFKRSLNHAVDLLDLTKDETNSNIRIELFIYTALIVGQLSIIQKNGQKFLTRFQLLNVVWIICMTKIKQSMKGMKKPRRVI